MPDQDNTQDPESGPTEPLNRAERRARSRGKKPAPPPPSGAGPLAGRKERVLPPRRSGRRGNR